MFQHGRTLHDVLFMNGTNVNSRVLLDTAVHHKTGKTTTDEYEIYSEQISESFLKPFPYPEC